MALRFKVLWGLIQFLVFLKHCQGFKFTIVHNNDMHARYDPMKGSSGKCPKGDDERGLCFGGFARVATAVAKARAEGPTLFLNAGDTYQGTPWFTLYKGDLAAELMNMLNPDAVSLGTHEFDDNIDGLLPFLNKVNFPIVSCNLDLSKVPQLESAKRLMPSTIITKLEKQIGIIGYLTPETRELAALNDLEYYNEIPSINAEAQKLIEKGVNIIIALGHSGYKRDQEIAINCPDVDVVIGGHSHTFLYTGNPPSKEKPEGNYPTIVVKPNGRQVPVVQAYAYTKYLGKIHLEFDNGGNLIYFKGNPILLDSSVELESNMKSLLEMKRKKIDELDSQVIGTTKVFLNGDRTACRNKECNFGNFICDSLVYGRVAEDFGGLYWTDASIALLNGGGIRASIDGGKDGTVTGADIATVLPFGNTISVARVKGANLVKSLEHSASLRNSDSGGGFLQVSGLRFVLNFNRPKGKRVTSIFVLCADCEIPYYQPLDRHKYYGVILPTFLLNGGDGHKYFQEGSDAQHSTMRLIDREIVTKYFQEHKIVFPKREQRITIVEKAFRSCAVLRSQSRFALVVFVAPQLLYFLPMLLIN
ncbi:protein 5NUC-like [Drosophila innubila]|uniref:protein 5NUC-like n=1 Tax=Drosophila innubila TaxID=198719 RepID=UPI00148C4310|nr:protein 5NUC-like [Drosophila innubila]